MSARSLNKVQLIGNLTRDPELRYTPQGTAVCNFGLATNRQWVTETGEKREDTEFHRIVAWNKLAEICSQLLTKGRKVYVEGRLSTRTWTAQDGTQRQTTEIVISEMIILDSKGAPAPEIEVPEGLGTSEATEVAQEVAPQESSQAKVRTKKKKKETEAAPKETSSSESPKEVDEGEKEDIPF